MTKYFSVTFPEGEDEMIIGVEAPFYNDPKPPNGEPGKAFFKVNILFLLQATLSL